MYVMEDVGLDVFVGSLVEFDDDVDGINVVDVEVGVEVGLGCDGGFVELEYFV